jgi:predicted RNA-binding Zn ribbon-like protein
MLFYRLQFWMIEKTDFVAGAPCLDFINTVGGHRDGLNHDQLGAYDDLLDWAVAGGLLTAARAAPLLAIAQAQPERAARTLRRAKKIREALHRIIGGYVAGRPPAQRDVDTANAEIGQALSNLRLRRVADGYEWCWEAAPMTLDMPLWPVARNAGDLLSSDELGRLRECASETCGWFFLDRSKNHSRRWCDMRDCGNREKMRRYRGVA